ncbi:molybdopterin-dependent oxidoreductase [Paraburkholderia sp. BCC1886]|uniref:molybdopterin-dependent oxidoreductase n=1 Tax=Paraburkholderia sp. BCC1886 TaxID=2562670 RepID=UPI0021B40C1E|nr:molybdopterin-dependent oxidoreductase [Paraburkholderia sp. BCC1886]
MVTENGRFIAQEPNPDHPTGAALCVKGRAAPEIVYRPERQLYPLMRTRPKGDPDPGWVRIGWDEALDRTAEAMSRIRTESGAEAVAFSWTTPSGTPISDNIHWIERFTHGFGTPNTAYGVEVCNWHKDFAHAYTFGRSVASPDFENTGCVVLWGHNPSATWLDHATATGSAVQRGAKLIVVDPRRAGFASRADQWLRVRPGSDGALALGLAREMISRGWFDEAFMTKWSNGPLLVRTDTMRFLRADELEAPLSSGAEGERLVARAADGTMIGYRLADKSYSQDLAPVLRQVVNVPLRAGGTVTCKSAFELYRELCEAYTPERVAELCWIRPEQISASARLLYEARPVCYYVWTGTGQHTNATQTDRAIATLMALTGSFDAPGGNVEFTKPGANGVSGASLLSEAQRAKCIELAHSSVGPGRNAWVSSDSLYRAILDGSPYQIRGMLGFGRNFLVTHGNAGRGTEAFKKLEFYAHADVVMSPTATMADIFLPVNTPWERDALRIGFEGSQRAESRVQFRQAAIESRGEARPDADIVFDLARRLGMSDLFWNGDIEAGMNYMLEPLGLNVEALRGTPNGIDLGLAVRYHKYRETGFKTHTGKIEVFSEVLRDAGEAPLPEFVEPAMSPMRPGNDDFPLVLTSAKVVQFCHSQHRDIPSLRKRSPEPEVRLHPDTASERGIEDNALVELRTHLGAVRMRAKLEASLDPRVVWAQYGWWSGDSTLGMPADNPFADSGANVNRLISDEATDPISGSVGHRSYLCEVTPVVIGNPHAWTGWRDFVIEASTLAAEGIMSFVLHPADGRPLAPFLGGQHVNVRATRPDGRREVRCYSLSGADNGRSYRISVKLTRDAGGNPGRMSALLHGFIVGGRVELQAPRGAFHLPVVSGAPDLARPVVLVAGGIGITPLIAMLHQLHAQRSETPVRLVYGIRSGKDHAFRDEIAVLREAMPHLEVVTFYSGAVDDDRLAHSFDHEGRISVEALLKGRGCEQDFFLCGPSALIESLTDALRNAGVANECIHLEAFGPSSRRSSGGHQVQSVHLSRSGKSFLWQPSDGSLLDQMERTGGEFPSGCRSGQCESCAMNVVEGEVLHPEGSAPVATGRCLPCVAIPLSALTLEA